MKHKHVHKDPVPFPNVALEYEKKFIQNYSLMQKRMNYQLFAKIVKSINKTK